MAGDYADFGLPLLPYMWHHFSSVLIILRLERRLRHLLARERESRSKDDVGQTASAVVCRAHSFLWQQMFCSRSKRPGALNRPYFRLCVGANRRQTAKTSIAHRTRPFMKCDPWDARTGCHIHPNAAHQKIFICKCLRAEKNAVATNSQPRTHLCLSSRQSDYFPSFACLPAVDSEQ